MIVDMSYWSKVLKRLLVFVLTIVGVYLAFKLAIFYMPFLIAFIISLFLEPMIRFLMKKAKMKRRTSAIIVLVLAFAIIVGLLTWGITSLITEASHLLQGLNGYFDMAYTKITEFISSIDFSRIQISDEVMQILQNSAVSVLESVSIWLKNFFNSMMNAITSIPTLGVYVVVSLIALYFICTDKIFMIDQIEHHLPQTWVKRLGRHIRELIKTLGSYLKAQVILIFVSFLISLIGLYAFSIAGLNVQYPLIAALGIGFVDALPIFGSGTVMIPWAIICAVNGDLTLGVALIILWTVMSIIRQLIEPRVVGNQIGIHPIFTLIAMYTGFKFIGILGMLIGPIILIILKNVFATLIDQGILKTIFDRT